MEGGGKVQYLPEKSRMSSERSLFCLWSGVSDWQQSWHILSYLIPQVARRETSIGMCQKMTILGHLSLTSGLTVHLLLGAPHLYSAVSAKVCVTSASRLVVKIKLHGQREKQKREIAISVDYLFQPNTCCI